MEQPLITSFFNKRKRVADDSSTIKSKVLILDEGTSRIAEETFTKSSIQQDVEHTVKNIVYQIPVPKLTTENGFSKRICDNGKISSKLCSKKKLFKRNVSREQPNNSDIRAAFRLKCNGSSLPEDNSDSQLVKEVSSDSQNVDASTACEARNVTFELLGTLSPSKQVRATDASKNESQKDDVRKARKELGLVTPKKTKEERQDLTLDELKFKLSKSSRINELRASIRRFNKKDEQLKEIEIEKKSVIPSSPQLQKFKSINLEVQVSPQKIFAASPVKRTPVKSPAASPLKSPAYKRLAYLAQPGVPALSLPYTYQCLAETFRCADTVSSMFHNRKENITFQKMKSAVQEMSRRNFTEQHLGQIKKVYSEAYTFRQEKCKRFGFPTKEKYELVITPNFRESDASSRSTMHQMMTSSMLLERRETFQQRLLVFVKNYHEEFLKTLDPPMVIPHDKLMRWHPEFDLEQVPVIVPDELPLPPHEEKCSSAKDILERAKTFLNHNQKMERALQQMSELEKDEKVTSVSTAGANSNETSSSLLKGIPKALLEKIRARQAAKALLAMTRTPAQDKEALQYSRLPELARILRNVFVAEKKNVLSLNTALTKLSNSYRESLTSAELHEHLHLLLKVVPEWLEVHHVRKADYLKMSKNLDLSIIIKKLEVLAENKRNI